MVGTRQASARAQAQGRPGRHQRGFALVAAIFLLVIVAAAIAFLARLSATQQGYVVLGVQSARAHQAARAGIEVATYRLALGGDSCADIDGATFTPPGLSDFTVTLACTAVSATISRVDASADNSARVSAGHPEYAWRSISATIQ